MTQLPEESATRAAAEGRRGGAGVRHQAEVAAAAAHLYPRRAAAAAPLYPRRGAAAAPLYPRRGAAVAPLYPRLGHVHPSPTCNQLPVGLA